VSKGTAAKEVYGGQTVGDKKEFVSFCLGLPQEVEDEARGDLEWGSEEV
jgi:hypothetical protein